MITQNKRLFGILITVVFLLLIPFVAMQVSNEVNWSLFDFIVMGVLLLGTGLTAEFIMRKVRNKEYRLLLIVAALLIFFLIWVEVAVGIIGTPFAGN